MDILTVEKCLAVLSVGWAALFTTAHTDIPVQTTETETTTPQYKLYPTCGIVTEISDTEWVFTDFGGNERVVEEDPEDWCEGDIVSAIMSDNCTPEIYDDIIIQTRYSGWVY